MKIKIEGKELKGIIEKALCNMDKKSSIPILTKVILTDNGSLLTAYTTDLEGYLQVNTSDYTSIETGSIGIDEEDLKVLLKMNNEVIITELENSILVQNGKKSISLIKYDIKDALILPEAEYEDALKFKENEFQEVINNLSTFTSDNYYNKVMQCLHFNINDSRIESLDGHRIGMKVISDSEKLVTDGKILIHSDIVSDLKKVLDKKSDAAIIISTNNKYIKVSGNNFTYIQRRVEGEYYRVNQMITSDYDFTFKADTEEMLQHMKYYTDNVINKDDKKPVILKIEENITTYGRNTRFEVSDTLEIEDHTGKNVTIGFNPYFLVDALKYSDTEKVVISGNNAKAPIMISAIKYSFIVLPVNLTEEVEKMESYLNKLNVA